MSQPAIMRILLFGRNGQLGWELERCLAPLGTVVALNRQDVDLLNPESTREVIGRVRPDVVVNAAAYTAVDAAESDSGTAHSVNAQAPGVMAQEAARYGARFIHFSTDYVFDGSLERAYREEDIAAPKNIYGQSKLEGELAVREASSHHLVLRTSWVFASRGTNFVLTMLRLLGERSELRVVADQHGAPTFARHLASATAIILAKGATQGGTFHISASGSTSWYGLASEIAKQVGRSTPIVPIATAQFPRPATRPSNSRLACGLLASTYGIVLPPWEVGLRQCLNDLGVLGT